MGAGASDKVAVLVAASGAAWEASALAQLERAPAAVLLKRCVDLHDLLATASTGLARVAVLSAQLPGLDVDSVDRLRRSGLGVVLVEDEASVGQETRRTRLGVDQVLTPTSMDRLAEAVRDADAEQPGEHVAVAAWDGGADAVLSPAEPGPSGRVVAVWGPAGAPGRTTVAVGLAAELAHRKRSALLVDADPYAGAVGQHLGVLDDVSGLLGAARAANAGALDAERLAGYARRIGDHLRVLTGLPRADRWPEVRPQAFETLVEVATTLAGHVVVDTGFSLEQSPADPFEGNAPARNQMTLASLGRADEVVVVGSSDPVSLSRLARGLVELHDLMPALRPRVVVNRARPSLGWGAREVRGMVEGFVTPLDVHFLPEDRTAADRALMAGRSLVESGDSTLRRAMASVVDGLVGAMPVRSPRARRAR